jgi:hypothetical protein
LRGASLEDFQGLMRGAFRDGPPRLTVNAFVIQTDRNTILVDSGGGSTTVYSMGRLPENLRAAGFTPEEFDTVLVTHIHPDHTSGLLDTEGKPAFPRAEVIVHEDEIGPTTFANPYLGDTFGTFGFIAMMIGGGTEKPIAALFGGVLLGVCAEGANAMINSQASDWFLFIVLVVVLIVSPRGLFSAGSLFRSRGRPVAPAQA